MVVDEKQNAEIRYILQNKYHNVSVIYCMKMLIKVNQIDTVSFHMHTFCSIVISRLYIEYNKNYKS